MQQNPQDAARLQLAKQIDALNAVRNELQGQRGSLLRQRNGLDEQRRSVSSSSPQAKDLDARIATIDARSAQIEKQLLDYDAQVTAATIRVANLESQPVPGLPAPVAPGVVVVPPPIRSSGVDVGRIVSINALVVLVLIVAAYRYAMRRLERTKPAMAGLSDEKVQQLQQSIDTIAIEVERISEAQRYLSKTIGEKSQVNR